MNVWSAYLLGAVTYSQFALKLAIVVFEKVHLQYVLFAVRRMKASPAHAVGSVPRSFRPIAQKHDIRIEPYQAASYGHKTLILGTAASS